MNRDIFRLAIPNILSNLTVPLLGMVDTALMGRQESEAYIGAVALGSVILSFVYWSFGFLRMGTTGLTAQAFGRGNQSEQMQLLGQSLLVGVGSGLLILLLQWPLIELSFWIMPGEPEVLALAKEYVFIRILAAPATIGLYAFSGWFLGMQNARFPMWLVILSNVINISLNLYFVQSLGMDVDGVAWATVIAQYAGFFMAIGLFWLSYRNMMPFLKRENLWNWQALRKFFSVNADIFLRTLCLIFVFAFFTAQSSAMDPLVLAANQILLQYFTTMSFAVDGFAFAAESLVGRFIGAGDDVQLRKAVRLLFIWGIGFGCVFAGVYAIWGEPLLYVFTDQQTVIDQAKVFLPWVIVFPLAGAVAFMWDGTYIGATAVRPMRNTLLLATFGVFLPVYFLTIDSLGNHGLWLAMTLFMVARSISLTVLAPKFIRITKNPPISGGSN